MDRAQLPKAVIIISRKFLEVGCSPRRRSSTQPAQRKV